MSRSTLLLSAGAALYVLATGIDRSVYDDALFFKRFALNVLTHGVFAWNVADGPVHGNTSQLMQLVATLVTAMSGDHTLVAIKLVSAVALWVALALLVRTVRRRQGEPLLIIVAAAAPIAVAMVHTGMETALVWLALAAFFAHATAPVAAPPGPVAAAGLTTIVYLGRPDAALIPVLYMILVHAGGHGRARTRRAPRPLLIYLGACAVLLGALLALCHAYYGSALPLSFYWKTLPFGRYDAAFVRVGLIWKARYLLTFLVFSAPLIVIAWPRRGPGPGPTTQLTIDTIDTTDTTGALLGAALGFIAYHLIFTDEVMGYHARFYLPALVPIAVAAALAYPGFARRAPRGRVWLMAGAGYAVTVAALFAGGLIETGSGGPLVRVHPWVYAAQVVVVLCLFGPAPGATPWRRRLAAAAAILVVAAFPPNWAGWPTDAQLIRRAADEVTTVRGIWDLQRCLAEPVHLYHSEIGIPGLLFPRSTVTDLAGLMSTRLTFDRPSFDQLCLSDRPDAIFLPHRFYVVLNQEIAASRCLTGYTRVVETSSSPLYVRNDRLADLRACAAATR